MLDLILLVLGGFGLSGGIAAVRAGEVRRWQAELVAYELRFPRDLAAADVTAFVRGLSGMVAAKAQRPFTVRAVALSITANTDGIRHHLLAPRSTADVILNSSRAAMPQVVTGADSDYRSSAPTIAVELGLAARSRPLRTDNPSAASAALLAAFQPLNANEEIQLQMILSPTGPVSSLPSRTPPKVSGLRSLFTNAATPARDSDEWRAAKEKRSDALFNVAIRLGATAPTSARAAQLLQRLRAAFHTANAPGGHLYTRRLPNRVVSDRIARVSVPLFSYPCPLNASELTGLVAFPIGGPALEGLKLGVSRRLPPSDDLPRDGLVLARSNYPGRARDIAIGWNSGGMEHVLLAAPTGAGKSTALAAIAHQIMCAGYGMLFIDPNRDAARAALGAAPSTDHDIVWFDPSDDPVVGFNPFEGMEAVPELAGDLLVSTTRHRWGGTSWGPQLEELMWVGGTTLAATGQTLVELPRVYADEAYRTRLLAQIDDPFVAQVFARFNSWSPEERARAAQSVLNKCRVFTRPELRGVLGQRRSTLDVDRALRDGQVVLASLPKARLGNDGALILAGLLLGRFWTAVLRRGELPRSQRRPFFVLVDEAHEVIDLPVSLGLALAESRKHGVGWILATQTIAGFPTRGGLRQEVLTNTRSKVVWSTSATEAQALARELGPDVRPDDVQFLGRHEVIVAASVGGKTTAPATGFALPPVEPTGLGGDVLARSRARYARPRAEVEAEIRARQTERPPGGSVGRRRRA